MSHIGPTGLLDGFPGAPAGGQTAVQRGSGSSLCVPASYLQGKERLLDGCQLWKVDLVAQVKQLQEKLNRLVYSLAFQNVDSEAFKLQQASAVACACVQEGSLDDGSHSPAGTAPGDVFDFDKTTWDLVDGIKNRDSWLGKEMPNVPIEEKLGTQDGSLSLQTRVHRDSCALSHAEEAKPLTETARMLDLSSWSSPEVLRKDSTLEPQPSLPLTPCSGALSLCSAGISPPERMGASLLQSHTPGLLSSPGDLAGQPLCWAESPSADYNPGERMAAVGASHSLSSICGVCKPVFPRGCVLRVCPGSQQLPLLAHLTVLGCLPAPGEQLSAGPLQVNIRSFQSLLTCEIHLPSSETPLGLLLTDADSEGHSHKPIFL